jgi:uncharacterized protein YicC (UPF0701 family)
VSNWKDRDENLSPVSPEAEIERLETENAKLREALDFKVEIERLETENAKLKEALDYIDDHGRALEAMEIMKAQAAEIESLKKTFVYTEIEKLQAEVERLKGCLRKEGSIEGYK